MSKKHKKWVDETNVLLERCKTEPKVINGVLPLKPKKLNSAERRKRRLQAQPVHPSHWVWFRTESRFVDLDKFINGSYFLESVEISPGTQKEIIGLKVFHSDRVKASNIIGCDEIRVVEVRHPAVDGMPLSFLPTGDLPFRLRDAIREGQAEYRWRTFDVINKMFTEVSTEWVKIGPDTKIDP